VALGGDVKLFWYVMADPVAIPCQVEKLTRLVSCQGLIESSRVTLQLDSSVYMLVVVVKGVFHSLEDMLNS